MSENRGIGTHREGKEPLEEHASSGIGTPREGKNPLEVHASFSSKPTVSAHGRAPEISTTEEPGIEIELGSLLFSGSPTKVGDKMVFFLFEVLVTQGDVTRGRLLIPVEAALQYFPSLADRQAYKEKIRMQHISDPARITDWLMFLTYDKSECCFVVDGIWQMFVTLYHLEVGDVIRFYKPSPVCDNDRFLFEIVKRRHAEIIHEFNPENLLFQLPLTNEGIQRKSLFIPAEEVSNHFPAVGIPAAETHHMERLYFTDDRNRQHCVKIVCCRGIFQLMEEEFITEGIFQLMMEEFITERNLGEGDTIRFYKADLQPKMNSRHFLIGFVTGRGDPTESGTAAVSDNTDRGGDDREGDGADRGGNRQGHGEGGHRSGGRKWWKFGLGGCCMASKKSNARTEES
ncbi:hypothetical protein RHSIM_Rhsim02G0117200 [Rhododendron simsii]|uniref:TF-B3 domain-containing protein n=1 Tax=Rhododendron simsii TaxID=118357 RepID=A0A834HJ41_RHOSS|nr:hypothetical protein RHSIM_Rhsim02G0117200 [Rhododendron simsii]